jgi:predicted nucleic acid-binding protein
LDELDAGERDAIRLALEFGIDTLVTDDRDARREAERRNLNVTGTVNLLERAARRGLIDFRAALEKLARTNFLLSARLRAEFLRRNP